MKIKLLISLLSIITVVSIVSAGVSYSKNNTLQNKVVELSKKEKENSGTIVKLNQTIETLSSDSDRVTKKKEGSPSTTYEDLLNEYTKKLEEASPKLVDEYNSEYPTINNGINGLAELSNNKIEKLATISNEGVFKMAELMYELSSNYEDYEQWSIKLIDVYIRETQKISDAYLASVNIQTTPDSQEVVAESKQTPKTSDSQPQQQELTEEAEPKYYTVQPGDNIYRIALNNGLTVGELKEINQITGEELEVGQVLRVK